ncbi:MAG: nuclear transport factor 2 family protein [Chloroflexi bacterium]|nr:nuclear transport factor 2 family protein [Chloroflexota bacterium]
MPELDQVQDWIDGYIRAWNSNDADDIRRLFTNDAAYYTEPFSAPWRGQDAVVASWLARQDEPGQTEFTWSPLVITDTLAVVQGQTTYLNPPRIYSNLWIIRLDSTGRCFEFTEWWMEQPSDTRAPG